VEELAIFVGNNDAGKSNVLKALNLFFNGDTGFGERFNFSSDFSLGAVVPAKKAKEITIELVFRLPESYRKKGMSDLVYMKKVWRQDGEREELRKYGHCYVKDFKIEGIKEFARRSKTRNLLDGVKYVYVPAIKDAYFFRELQGRLYDGRASSMKGGWSVPASVFENFVQVSFINWLKDVNIVFQNENSIRLPKNLRSIFEELEFSSSGIPLSKRGDGIKIRHIPSILRFIERQSSSSGGGIVPHIWGFEEPENNVEYISCGALCD